MKYLLFISLFSSFLFCSELTLEDSVFLSGLTGVLIGFTILFFSVLITIKVGSK